MSEENIHEVNLVKVNEKLTKCAHFNKGFCKYTNKGCKFLHPTENWACDLKECPKRHPRTCKYGSQCTYFINGICFYEHDKQNVSKTSTDKQSKLAKKVDAIFDMLKQKEA